jgi:hypothetical protein
MFGYDVAVRPSENGIAIVMTEFIGSELANLKLRYKSASFAFILLGTPSITDHVDVPGVILGVTITSRLVAAVPSYFSIIVVVCESAKEVIVLTKLGDVDKLVVV